MHRFFSFTPRPVLAADHVRGSENPHDQGGRVSGRLAENIVHFARALRAAGIPVGPGAVMDALAAVEAAGDRKSTRLNSSHTVISYAVFCLKKKKTNTETAASNRTRRARHSRRQIQWRTLSVAKTNSCQNCTIAG